MGGNESSNRKVSFELDEHERVRVLQGIRLSEDVVNRMKEPHQSKRDHQSTSLSPSSSSQVAEGNSKLPTGVQPPTVDSLGRKPSEAEEDLYKRYEQEQAMVQDELLRLAKRERDAARERLSATLQQERNSNDEERQKTAQLSQELQRKEEELKQRDAFYKEQLARIEQKNADIYKMTLEQYHEAVTNAEDRISADIQSAPILFFRDFPRNTISGHSGVSKQGSPILLMEISLDPSQLLQPK